MTKRPFSRLDLLASRPRAAGGAPLAPEEIRELRGPRTRQVFARQLGVSTATVYLWEVGRVRPSAPSLSRLRSVVARALRRAKRS